MPSISDKGRLMPPSPIRKLVPYAEAAKKQGRKVYHLNIGQPDIDSPKQVLNAIQSFSENNIAYSHSAGSESYRIGLANYYASVGIDVNENDIIVTSGGSEALLFGFMTCFNPGDEVIVSEPYYANYNGFATSAGVVIKAVTAKIENGFALPPVEEFEQLITPKTKGILICNPGNPTGYLYTKEELNTIRDIVEKHDLYLFADEVYREFVYDGLQHNSVMHLEGIEQNTILVDSVSKRYSMCGSRVGCMVSKNKEVMATAMKFAQARLSPPTLDVISAEAALATPQSYFDGVIAEYVHRRNVLVEGLNKIPGVTCPMPTGAFYAVAELPVENADDFCQWILESFEYENQTVMMAPASGFYSDPKLGPNQVRLAYVLKEEDLKASVLVLEKALEAYNNK